METARVVADCISSRKFASLRCVAASWITFAKVSCSVKGRFLDSLHFEKSQINDRFSRSFEELLIRDILVPMDRSLVLVDHNGRVLRTVAGRVFRKKGG